MKNSPPLLVVGKRSVRFLCACIPVALKRHVKIARIAIATLFAGFSASVSLAGVVNIPDAELELAIRIELGIPTANITDADMAGLLELKATYEGISDLTGLETAVNATSLLLKNNAITNLGPISGLVGLDTLDVRNNPILLSPGSTQQGIVDALIAAGVSSLTYDDWTDGIVNIPDANLLQAIRDKLVRPTGNLTYGDMSGLANLSAPASSIGDLTGLEAAVNATYFVLYDNDIVDVTPLSELNDLTYLHLASNDIINVRPLSGLVGLEGLLLNSNYNLSNIRPLANLSNLVQFYVNDTNVSDLIAASSLTTLEKLSIGKTDVSDLSLISNLTALKNLFLNNTDIVDLSPLLALNNLQTLDIKNSGIMLVPGSPQQDIVDALELAGVDVDYSDRSLNSVLFFSSNLLQAVRTELSKPTGNILHSDMAMLTSLDLSGLSLSNLKGLEAAFALTDLDLSNNDISSLEVIQYLENIQTLDITSNSLNLATGTPQRGIVSAFLMDGATVAYDNNSTDAVDIPDFALGASIAQALNLESGVITYEHMASLTSLASTDGALVDLTGIEFAMNLTELFISANGITDLSPLTALEELTILDISYNGVVDISYLSELEFLEDLILYDNQVDDISPLTDLKYLNYVNAGSNEFSDLGDFEDLEALQSLDVRNNQFIVVSGSPQKQFIDVLIANGVDVTYTDNSSSISSFQNEEFLQVIRNKIEKFSGDITFGDVAGLRVLSPDSVQLSNRDLRVLRLAFNIINLDISNNQLSSLDSIQDLENIQDLDVRSNLLNLAVGAPDRLIVDAFVAEGTTVLFDDNGLDAVSISDPVLLQAIRSALNIPTGDIMYADIVDLTSLDVSGLSVVDLSGLDAAISLTTLNLSGTGVLDLSPLLNFRGLQNLDVTSVGINLSDRSPQRWVLDALVEDGVTVAFDDNALEVVNIPDAILLQEIRNTLGKPTGDITYEDMTFLSNGFTAESLSISDLTGLEAALNLRYLFLNDNSISDLEPLSGLTELIYLEVADNLIADISPLAGLVNLTWLDVQGNEVSDIGALSTMISVDELDISYNQVSDLEPLSGFSYLGYFDLSNNSVSDLSVFSNVSDLGFLDVSSNNILLVNGSPQQAFVDELLNLGDVTYDDWTNAVVGIPDANLLEALRIALAKPTGDIEYGEMSSLTSFDVSGLAIADLAGLEGAFNLTALDLSDNAIQSIASIQEFENLQTLNIAMNDLDLGQGTSDRLIVDAFVNNGVSVVFDAAVVTSDLVVVEWEDDYIGPLDTTYSVWRGLVDDFDQATLLVEDLTELSHEDRSSEAGVTYYYWIRPVRGDTVVALMDSISGARDLPVPEGLKASQGDFSDRVRLTWAKASGVETYSVFRSPFSDPSSQTLLQSGLELPRFDDFTAVDGVVYLYAVSSVGFGEESSLGTVASGYRVENGITTVRASDGLFEDKIVVAWDAFPDATSYRVLRSSTNDSSTATVLAQSLTSPSYDDTIASDNHGVTYYYWVRATVSGVEGPFSNTDAGHVPVARNTGIQIWGDNTFEQTKLPSGDLSEIVEIAAGVNHSLALRSDGTVAGWGRDDYGQATSPVGLIDVVEIAVGYDHSLALKADGSVVAWGRNTFGKAAVPNELGVVIDIAAGAEHSIALLADGTVAAWGGNDDGQTSTPRRLSQVVEIASGGFHNIVMKADGTIAVWGDNTYGQLNVPATVDTVLGIASGWNHLLVITPENTVIGWGDNSEGQLDAPESIAPVSSNSSRLSLFAIKPLAESADIVGIAGGLYHSLALTAGGQLLSWGDNSSSQTDSPENLSLISKISAGDAHNITLSAFDEPRIQSVLTGGQAPLAQSDQMFKVRATGGADITYQWYIGESAIAGAVGSTLVLGDVSESDTGAYTVKAISGGKEALSSPVAIDVDETPASISGTVVRILHAANGERIVMGLETTPANLKLEYRLNGTAYSLPTKSVDLTLQAVIDELGYSRAPMNGIAVHISNVATNPDGVWMETNGEWAKVHYSTVEGFSCVLQSSSDMIAWESVDSVSQGDGESRVYETQDSAKLYYRVVFETL